MSHGAPSAGITQIRLWVGGGIHPLSPLSRELPMLLHFSYTQSNYPDACQANGIGVFTSYGLLPSRVGIDSLTA